MTKFASPFIALLLIAGFLVFRHNSHFPGNANAKEIVPVTGAADITKAEQDPNGPVPLAAEVSDIPTDPKVTWGVLDSGMRYAILPNPEPPGRLSLRLHVDAGSLMEKDNQQGLAHFLEHMAFNGTTNFEAGKMVKYFQRLGMGFGNHTNAHTSFNETVYKLELPNTEEKTLDDSFKLLRDYADGMQLPAAEIERERGIIMSEKRSRDSVGWRTFVEQIKFAFPEHLISDRMPIGIEEVIQGAPRERFVEFYNDWYTPNRMVLIAVGDTDVATMKNQIDKHFSSLKPRDKSHIEDMGKITNRGLVTHYHYEEEAGETSISIETFTQPSGLPHNTERAAEELRRNLATRIVNRRFERIAKDETSPISAGRMHAGDFYDLGFAMSSSIGVDCKPENWEAALQIAEQELRRTLEFGFTDAELLEAKANMLNAYENAAEQADTRISRDLANRISRAIGERKVFVHPKDSLEWAQAELEKVSADECLDAIKKIWNSGGETLLMLSGNAKVEDANDKLTAVYKESSSVAVTAPEEIEAAEFAYSELPEPGKIAERKEIEDLEVTQLRFENNVRVNLKVTDFEEETIHVRARIGAGTITEPKDKPGLATFLSGTFTGGGLEAHSDDDLQRLFAGKSVGGGLSVSDDAFTFTGKTKSADLMDQLLLMRAYITNPGFRKEAVTEFLRGLDYMYQQIERTAQGISSAKGSTYLHGGDSRFGYPDREVLESRTIEEARAWVGPALKDGYLELTVVGDFDKEEVIEKLAATFGSLPEREAEKPAYEQERTVEFPEGGTKEFTFDSEIPKALTLVYWPTIDIFDIKKTRRLGILGAVLDDRLREKVREELGDSYSPFAHNIPSDTWKDYGYIFAAITVDPAQCEKVAGVVAEIAKDLSTGDSITQDELERAKKPNIVSIEEMRRTNRYWLGSVLESSQEYPERLDWSRHFVDDYKAIALDEVNALAKEFLKDDKRVTIMIKPEKK
ncbi:MAG: insulinase family protein [Verrucomicrobiales bacterium]|nr:insulinase family protein [Verrucomicrobiales bacterium]